MPLYPLILYALFWDWLELCVVVFFQILAEREKELQKQQEEEKQQASVTLKKEKEEKAPKTFKQGVGKYINPTTM